MSVRSYLYESILHGRIETYKKNKIKYVKYWSIYYLKNVKNTYI